MHLHDDTLSSDHVVTEVQHDVGSVCTLFGESDDANVRLFELAMNNHSISEWPPTEHTR